MAIIKSDVIIIGGGIVGCSIAYELIKRRFSVVLLEKSSVGDEASGRNGGGVRQQNRHKAELPLAKAAVKLWTELEEELDCDLEYRQTGNLKLVRSTEEYRLYRKNVEVENKMGIKVEFLSPEETRSLLPFLSKDIELLGATYCSTDGSANPLLVTKAIARAAKRLGVQIREYEALKALKVKNERITSAITEENEYQALVFVISAGPWARSICKQIDLDIPLTIKKAQILMTEPLPPLIREFISADVGYMRQTLNGGFLLGIPSMPYAHFDNIITLKAFSEAAKGYLNLFPFFKHVKIIRGWAGLTAWTPDQLPIIDKAPDIAGLYLTTGFSGHGFCLGPIIGKLITQWIVDGSPSLDLSPFLWTRFKRSST